MAERRFRERESARIVRITMKRCAGCQEEKPVAMFHRWGRKGGDGYQRICKACKKVRDRAIYENNRDGIKALKIAQRRRAVADHAMLKASTPCADCGGKFHPAAMQWDHLPGQKKVNNISTLINLFTLKKAAAEMKKCQLVCANCHAVRTFERREAEKHRRVA